MSSDDMVVFRASDYAVLSFVLTISAGIGVYYNVTGGKQKTTKEYLLANKSMSVLPVAFSLTASFMSAITLLGVSVENYQYGTQFVVINLAYVLATPIAAYLIIPVFHCLESASVYEYLEVRFGYATRLLASLGFSLQLIFYMSIVLYAPSLALEAVTGLSLTFSIFLVGAVCTFYATLGGMKAVLITDVFQSILMFASIFAIIIYACIKAGGFSAIWMAARDGGRLEFFNFNIDPTVRHTWFTQIIGGAVTYLSIYGVNQTQVQRLLAVRNVKDSVKALWWSLPILILLSVSTCFCGLCIYYYYQKCDPLLEGRINSRDQLLPLYVMDTIGHLPGMSGLFISGIFSGSLSTISSAISSLTAVTLEDYVKPIWNYCSRSDVNETRKTCCSKIVSLIYGTVCIGLAFSAGSLGGILQASLSLLGVVGGPLLAVFLLGMCTVMANQKGVIIGLLLGLTFSSCIAFGTPKPPIPTLPLNVDNCPIDSTTNITYNDSLIILGEAAQEDTNYFYLYRVSYMWYSVLGFLVTFMMGFLTSWICLKCQWDTNDLIYVDASRRTIIKYELFTPSVATHLRKKRISQVHMNCDVSGFGKHNSTSGQLNKGFTYSVESMGEYSKNITC